MKDEKDVGAYDPLRAKLNTENDDYVCGEDCEYCDDEGPSVITMILATLVAVSTTVATIVIAYEIHSIAGSLRHIADKMQ